MVILLDNTLWALLYDWLDSLDEEGFEDILPILRRSFSRYSEEIRKQIGEKVKSGTGDIDTDYVGQSEAFDEERATRALDHVKGLLYG